jgi:hypothetical protein
MRWQGPQRFSPGVSKARSGSISPVFQWRHTGPDIGLIGNDGVLKAIFTQSLHAVPGTRIGRPARESGSCGAPSSCVHRAIRLSSAARVQNRRFGLISRENVTPAE